MKISRRKVLVALIFTVLFAVVMALLTPCVRVSPGVVEEIKPGMTIKDVEGIIGGPPGWYDGVWGIRSNETVVYKGEGPSWVNARGEIIVHEDDFHKVTGARFREVEIINWDFNQLIWERMTRGVFRPDYLRSPYKHIVDVVIMGITLALVLALLKGFIDCGFGTVIIVNSCICVAFVSVFLIASPSDFSFLPVVGGMALILFTVGALVGAASRKGKKQSSITSS